jgi:hypothetical protein
MTARFCGTDDPRHLRVLDALRNKPQSRESIDAIAGVSNGPDIIMDLRTGGLEIPCERVTVIDRDGKLRRPGIYSLTQGDRSRLNEWLATRNDKGYSPC